MRRWLLVLLALLIAVPVSAQTRDGDLVSLSGVRFETGTVVDPSVSSDEQQEMWRWVNGRLYGPGISIANILASTTPTDCSAPQYSFSGDTDTGIGYIAANAFAVCNGGAFSYYFTTNGLQMQADESLVWSSSNSDPSASPDLFLTRDAANTLAQRNGTNAQTARVYKSDAAGSNDSYYAIDNITTANVVYVGMQTTGTGTQSVRADVGAATKTLTESSATGYVTLSVANSSACAGYVQYTVFAADATNTQIKAGTLHFGGVATSGGVVTAAVSDTPSVNPVTSGTLTNTMDTATAANAVTLRANAASSLTQTTLEVRYKIVISSGTCTVTPL